MIAARLTAGPHVPNASWQSWLDCEFQLSWGMARTERYAQGNQEKYGFISAFQIFKVLHALVVICLEANLIHCWQGFCLEPRKVGEM